MKVTVLAPALREIIAALEYYEERASGLARSLDSDLTRSLDFIKQSPNLGSPFQSGTRRVLLHRFPYIIVYKELEDEILVVAFAHHKQRPGYWRDRTPGPSSESAPSGSPGSGVSGPPLSLSPRLEEVRFD